MKALRGVLKSSVQWSLAFQFRMLRQKQHLP